MKNSKLKKGDEVKVMSGKDKGKIGKIEKVFQKTGKMLVTGVNLYKRHLKARSQSEKSEIVTISKPLPVGNISLICPSCKVVTRVGFRIEKSGKAKENKVRFCRKCDKIIS